MKMFVKSILFAGLGVCCLTLASDARQSGPAAVSAPPATTAGDPLVASPFIFPAVDGRPTYRSYAVVDGTDGRASQLAKQIADAKTDDEKEKMKSALKELLVKQFDDRQKRHEQEIATLEAQVKKLKEMVAKRSENKKEIIDERTRQLEREAKGLGW